MLPDDRRPLGVMLIAGLAAFAFGLSGLRCLDVWFHLRTGQLIWETAAIPAVDTLSHTRAGADWITHEWAFELPLWGVWRLAGDRAMVVVQAALAGLTFALLALACVKARASQGATLLAVGLGALIASSRFLARPHMASAVFTGLLLVACLRHRNRPDRLIYGAIPLFALWANVHAGVVQGLFIVGLFAAEEWLDRRAPGPLVGVAGLGALASLVNPHGWEALWYPFFLVRSNDAGLFDIVELRPPDWPSPVHAFAGAVLVSLLVAWRRLSLATRVLALLGVGLGVTRSRASLDLAIYGAPALALAFTEVGSWLPRRVREVAARFPAAPTGLVVFGAFVAFTGYRPNLEVAPGAIPAGAMQFVDQAQLGGQMLNAHLFGGWLVWAHPDRKVYFDGRNEVFVSLFEETRTTPIDALSRRYDLGYAVLDYPTDRDVREVDIPVDINDVLLVDPAWHLVFFDDVARVYALDRPENAVAIANNGYRHIRPGLSDFEYVRRYAVDPVGAAAFAAEAQRAIAASPHAVMPRMHLVELLRLAGNVEDALLEIDAIPLDDPFRVSRMGGLLLQAGRVSEAREALRKAVIALPDNASVWSNLGLAELRLGDLPAAVIASKRAIALDEDLLEARENLVIALERLGSASEASTQKALAASTRERLARSHFDAGRSLLESGYAERASIELERAGALAPGSANTQYLLGVAYNVVGAPALAERHLRRTLALEPAHPYALLELANAQLALGDAAGASATLVTFLGSGPEPKWEAVARKTLALAAGGAP